jgi:ADP-ribose pyrophosphatase YjhB (NUDIX family)
MDKDIIFKTDEYVFSYRVAGLLIHNGKILLQRPKDDTAYAIPGGHVALGETNKETLVREFKEEINVNIKVDTLKWIGELFFPWGNKPCHQICLFYNVLLNETPSPIVEGVSDSHNFKKTRLVPCLTENNGIPLEGVFWGTEQLEDKSFKLEFSWIDINDIETIELYPIQAKKYLANGVNKVEHFVYKE